MEGVFLRGGLVITDRRRCAPSGPGPPVRRRRRRKRPPATCVCAPSHRSPEADMDVSPWCGGARSASPPAILSSTSSSSAAGRTSRREGGRSIALAVYIGLAVAFGIGVWYFAGHQYGTGVLRRLADGVLPLGRQPVHLPDHHEQVRRTEEAAAERAARRHRAGADHARHLHRGRRRGDQQVQLGLLHLRALPDLHGGQARQGGRRGRRRVRGEPADQVGGAAVPGDLRVARHQDLSSRRTAGG